MDSDVTAIALVTASSLQYQVLLTSVDIGATNHARPPFLHMILLPPNCGIQAPKGHLCPKYFNLFSGPSNQKLVFPPIIDINLFLFYVFRIMLK